MGFAVGALTGIGIAVAFFYSLIIGMIILAIATLLAIIAAINE